MNKATIEDITILLGSSFTVSHVLGPDTYRSPKGISVHPDRNCNKWFQVNGEYHLLDVLIMTWRNHGIFFNHQGQNQFMGSFSFAGRIWLSKEVLYNFYMKLFIALYVGHVEIGPIMEYEYFSAFLPLLAYAVQRADKAIQ